MLCRQRTIYVLSAKTTRHSYLNRLISAKIKNLKGYKWQKNTSSALRNYYRKQVQSSQERIKALTDNQGQPNSLAISLTYSFDHAQQVHYPSNPQQPGPLFLKTPRKCGIFGVCSEGCNTQVNYLIDEAQSCGKGANSIVSMVHHYWCNFTKGEKRYLSPCR